MVIPNGSNGRVSQCCGKAKVEAVASHTYYIWTTTSETGMRTPV